MIVRFIKLFRHEQHWRGIICRNAHLAHQNWYRISLIDWLIDWLIIYCFTSCSRIFLLHGDVTIAGEGLQHLGLRSALRAFEQGGIFIVPHLLWHGTWVYCGLIRRTTPFSRLLQHTRGCGGSILTRILTGPYKLHILSLGSRHLLVDCPWGPVAKYVDVRWFILICFQFFFLKKKYVYPDLVHTWMCLY
jgi:hypothetical protein